MSPAQSTHRKREHRPAAQRAAGASKAKEQNQERGNRASSRALSRCGLIAPSHDTGVGPLFEPLSPPSSRASFSGVEQDFFCPAGSPAQIKATRVNPCDHNQHHLPQGVLNSPGVCPSCSRRNASLQLQFRARSDTAG